MNSTHPTAEQLERYRRRAAPPAETLAVDSHIASCDRCFAQVRADVDAVTLAPGPAERHLDFDALVTVVEGRAGADVERHAADCVACADEVADLRRMREAMIAGRAEGRPAFWLAAAAAIVVIVAAGVWLWTRRSEAPAPPPIAREELPPQSPPQPQRIVLQRPAVLDTVIHDESVLRGAAESAPFELHEPVGTVVLDDRPRLRWSALPETTSYAIVVADAETGSVEASGSIAGTTWRATTPLRRGRTYMWQVTARSGGRSVTSPAPSEPPALFRVAEVAELPRQRTPLDRGVALAGIGALDDAERELERALTEGDTRAKDLLAQVRSWRQRALPTTTNGAQ